MEQCLLLRGKSHSHGLIILASLTSMRHGILLIGLICLLVSGYLWMVGASWDLANSKASDDAHVLSEVKSRPARIGFFLAQDSALLKAVIWSQDGSVVYPGGKIYIPTQFELSFNELEELTQLTSQNLRGNWSNYDRDGAESLYCQTTPRTCLIYDRTELQKTLQTSLRGSSLRQPLRSVTMAFLMLLALLCLYAYWRFGPTYKPDDQLVLVPEQHSARRGQLEVVLTPRDLQLLVFLKEKQGNVATKDELYDAGWGRDFMPNSRALDQHVINLRKKLDPDKSRSPIIETVRGVGYRLL